MRERERAGDERLRRDDRGQRRQDDERGEQDAGRQQVKRVARRLRGAQDQGPLAEVVEQQRGQDEREPCDADGTAAEVAHVGIQRLGAGDREHDGAQREERLAAVRDEELDRVPGVQRRQHARAARQLGGAEDADSEEPGEHDGREDAADSRGTALLEGE
jgi:hypothetical protein